MIQFCAYQGVSLVSRLIRWQTRSVYSHIAVRFMDDKEVRTPLQYGRTLNVSISCGSVIEAWSGGVRLSESVSDSHTPHTKVDVFEFDSPLNSEEERLMTTFLCCQIGKAYDYLAVFRFLTREPVNRASKGKWFCSELAFEAALVARRELLSGVPAWKVPPAWIPMSPLLKFVGSEWTV